MKLIGLFTIFCVIGPVFCVRGGLMNRVFIRKTEHDNRNPLLGAVDSWPCPTGGGPGEYVAFWLQGCEIGQKCVAKTGGYILAEMDFKPSADFAEMVLRIKATDEEGKEHTLYNSKLKQSQVTKGVEHSVKMYGYLPLSFGGHKMTFTMELLNAADNVMDVCGEVTVEYVKEEL